MKHDIFISYRRNGGFETAYYLHEHLEKDGYGVTFDIDALRSGRFDETLLARIDECTDFIVVLNRGCFDRCLDPDCPPENDWLRRELARALEKRKNVIPILLAGFDGFPAHLPGDIDDVRYMNGPKYVPQYIDEFYRILKTRFLRSVPRRKAGKRTGLRLAGLLLAAGLTAGAALSVRMFRDAAGGTGAASVEDAPAGNPASPAPEAGGREIADAAEMPPAPPAPPAVTAEPAPETEAAEPEAEVAPAAVRKPKIRLSATVDGREVAATVTEGLARGGARTPVTVDLETGGKYRFALEYQTGGKRYAGEVSLKADEVAAKEVRVPLAEVVAKTLTPPPAALAATELGQGARAGEEKTIVLPGGAAMRMVWCPPGTFTMGSPARAAEMREGGGNEGKWGEMNGKEGGERGAGGIKRGKGRGRGPKRVAAGGHE